MTDWFEPLYADAAQGSAVVPWDREYPNAMLVAWAGSVGLDGTGRAAAVTGCGYGRDAEYLASLGFEVTAFDVAPSAIEGARLRHHASRVNYRVADLFDLPPEWVGAFAFVLESHNVQALPDPPRSAAIAAVPGCVAPGGVLVVLAAAAKDEDADADEDADGDGDGPPWPLRRAEVEAFAGGRLEPVELSRYVAEDGIPRWRAVFAAPPS
jgi:SAM-dependent methyltransferase